MKFKTVSEFIHALEVEGKKFEHPEYDKNYKNYFVGWRNGSPREIAKNTLASYAFDAWTRVLTHDWQEYIPEPETEEIELEEWLRKGSTKLFDNFYYTDWVPAGHEHFAKNAFKTGVTRKVEVPK